MSLPVAITESQGPKSTKIISGAKRWIFDRLAGRKTASEKIEIPYEEVRVIVGKFEFHGHIFKNPDRYSSVAAIIISVNNDPNFKVTVLPHPDRGYLLHQDMSAVGIPSGVYSFTGIDEMYAARGRLGLSTADAEFVVGPYKKIEGRPASVRVGSLNDPQVREYEIARMQNFVDKIHSTDLISADPRIREAMIDKMSGVLPAALQLKLEATPPNMEENVIEHDRPLDALGSYGGEVSGLDS